MPQTRTQIHFASGSSSRGDITDALDDVLSQIATRLDGPADLVVFFATGHHVQHFAAIHTRLAAALSPQVELGMSVEGVIGVQREIEEQPGLSVLAARLPGVHQTSFALTRDDWTSPRGLIDRLKVRHAAEPKLMLLLGDPYSTPINKVLPLIGEAWPGLPIVGGMASSGRKPGDNRLMFNGDVAREGAVGVLLSGDFDVQCTVSQGCRPIGQPYVITGSQRHVVQELGGHKALKVVQEMVEQMHDDDRHLLRKTGLLVGRVINEYKERFGRGDFLIRTIAAIDEADGYIAINDSHVRVGQTVQFHVRDQQTAREDMAMLLEAQRLHGGQGGALLFSCNGRGRRLFETPDTDAMLVHSALGDIPLAGCFAAGEIGPIGDRSFVHGHTACLVVLRENSADPKPPQTDG